MGEKKVHVVCIGGILMIWLWTNCRRGLLFERGINWSKNCNKIFSKSLPFLMNKEGGSSSFPSRSKSAETGCCNVSLYPLSAAVWLGSDSMKPWLPGLWLGSDSINPRVSGLQSGLCFIRSKVHSSAILSSVVLVRLWWPRNLAIWRMEHFRSCGLDTKQCFYYILFLLTVA